MRRLASVALLPLLLWGAAPEAAAAGSCAGSAALDATLFLIGDAGAAVEPEPALEALARQGARRVAEFGPERTAVAFLGDNVYPIGVPAHDHRGRAKAERRLDAVLSAVRRSGMQAFLVPGNHDWSNAGRDGWDAVRRQARFVAESGVPGARVAPPDGCPGPQPAALGEHLLLLFLDTQWWLHDGPKPRHPDSSCPEDAPDEVVAALDERLRAAAPRRAVVMAHHPLATGGPHGGNFGWREHLFPLLESASWLWAPLPGFGSLYAFVRGAGVSDQDLMGSGNRLMREAIEGAFDGAPPLVYAAGHDHGLQVIRGGSARWLVVSGGGGRGIVSRVRAIEGTEFAVAASGFVRLDARQDGAVELTAVVAEDAGSSREAYRACLTDGR